MKTPFLFWLSLSIGCMMLTSTALPQQGARVALVIGNANYPDASAPLSNPIKDARALAEELRRINFTVDFKENLGREEMQQAVDTFTGKIRNGATALLYFSGFGLQSDRKSYIIPVNAQIWTEADVRRDGIGVDEVLAEMQRKGAKVKIIILDAARRSPFERRFRPSPAGLAPIAAPIGTLALYSAAPGKLITQQRSLTVTDSKGANSLFISELIKELRSPNLTAEQMFNRARIAVSRASNNAQVPWVASSLIEEFYFSPSRSRVTAAPQKSPARMRPAAPQSSSIPTKTSPLPREPARVTTPPPRKSAQASTSSQGKVARTGSKPGDVFRDCSDCPALVVVSAGSFDMGSLSSDHEKPLHRVNIAKLFAIGRYEVTFNEWDECVAARGCKRRADDRRWGRGDRPVINISWLDAKEYVAWLTKKTGHVYRLPTEAEWEYAARAGTGTPYWWGRGVGARRANCRGCRTGQRREQTLPVGSYKPNAFGLYDTSGNAAEWVEDCWNDGYRGAPTDGSAWITGECRLRVLRGGSFDSQASYVRSNARFRYDADVPYYANGFRVVRELQK
jgi:formylglycine-generating enzyme required for sulfatase activity